MSVTATNTSRLFALSALFFTGMMFFMLSGSASAAQTESTAARWNPCKPIHYVIDPTSGPRDPYTYIHEAFRAASRATNIPVKYDGIWQHGRSHSDSGDPVLVYFKAEPNFYQLGYTEPAIENGQIVGGVVQINPRIKNYYPNVYRKVMYHEIGHVFGLPHATPKYDKVAVMGSADAPYHAADLYMFGFVAKRAGDCRR